jgi:hypothetical protein
VPRGVDLRFKKCKKLPESKSNKIRENE